MLKEVREALGLTQEELAARLRYEVSEIRRLENLQYDLPTASLAIHLSRLSNCLKIREKFFIVLLDTWYVKDRWGDPKAANAKEMRELMLELLSYRPAKESNAMLSA
jgi:transcriptional regulator with XRE-family HTH domain